MKLIAYFAMAFILTAVAGSREKRLVLHSDTDIATEVLNLRAEMENLKTALSAQGATLTAKHDNATAKLQAEIDSLTSSNDELNSNLNATVQAEILRINATLTAEIVSLTMSNNNLNTELSKMQLTLNDERSHEHGSVYVRWGRTHCPGNGTNLVYKGYMAGTEYREKGNGANHLCLPDDPTWAKYTDANDGNRANIYGTEYQVNADMYFGKHVVEQDVPCALCQTPGVSVMIPARTNCYPGWNLEYSGYLMADRSDLTSSDYACVDADPEFLQRGHADTDGNLLYLVQSRCGTLACPPYFDYRELACSVCSK